MTKLRLTRRAACGLVLAILSLLVLGWWSYPKLSERYTLHRLASAVTAIRGDSVAVGSFQVRGPAKKLVARGNAYVLYKGRNGLQVLFPLSIKHDDIQFPDGSVNPRVQVCGYLYSDINLPSDTWIDFSNLIKDAEAVSTWDNSMRVGHWYWVEPYISDD